MKARYSVYIPTVSLSAGIQTEQGGSLLEVYAQPYQSGEDPDDLLARFRKARPAAEPVADRLTRAKTSGSQEADEWKALYKQWDRVAALLRPAGLYQSGSWAASMALKVGLERPFLALYQQFRKQAYIADLRLRLASAHVPDDWRGGEGAIEGRSADLGLALALLLAASRAPRRLVIATGRLGGQPGGTHHHEADVEILSVGKVPEKLQLIERLGADRRLPRGPRHQDPVWVFTPLTLEDGRPVTEHTLPVIARLAAMGIEVIPVKTLRTAAQRLGARKARWMPSDYLALSGVLASVLVGNLTLSGIVSDDPPRPQLMVTAPELNIRIHKLDHGVEDLAKIPVVSLDDQLILEMSRHPGEFRYLFTLDGDGDAYIHPLPDGGVEYGPIWIPDSSPPAMAVLMLVSEHPWSDAEQAELAAETTALHLSPKLDRKRYHFVTGHCTATDAPPRLWPRGAPPVYPDAGAPPAACSPWAVRLLEVLLKHRKNLRLDGQAFEIAEP
jgi:hypothetical protein